ncbi:hypothetical protein FRC03_007771 [Tulasnella sp. 419]|nr:hypothetical protein FRC03_007771 [Tulasnella sp. 419]
MGDSFQLRQLFFVEHVAIKHAVYLELVEKDLKCRKDGAAQDKHSKESGKPGGRGQISLRQKAPHFLTGCKIAQRKLGNRCRQRSYFDQCVHRRLPHRSTIPII